MQCHTIARDTFWISKVQCKYEYNTIILYYKHPKSVYVFDLYHLVIIYFSISIKGEGKAWVCDRGYTGTIQYNTYNTYIHTYIHTCVHTYIHTYIHTHIHTYIHTYIHTHIHTHIHTNIHTYIHTYIHAYIHTYIHTYIYAYIPICNTATIQYQTLQYCYNTIPYATILTQYYNTILYQTLQYCYNTAPIQYHTI